MYHYGKSGQLFHSQKAEGGAEYRQYYFDHPGDPVCYVVNSKYVFQDKCETLKDHVQPFCKFVSARLVTMVIEVGGVWLLVSVMGLNDMIGKFLTQFIVLILNYVSVNFLCLQQGNQNNEGKERENS